MAHVGMVYVDMACIATTYVVISYTVMASNVVALYKSTHSIHPHPRL